MLLAVFLIVFVAIFCLAQLAPRLGLIAIPGEHRTHESPTPVVGGIAMFIGVSIAIVFASPGHLALLPSIALLILVGVLDDRLNLPSWSRFIAQGLAAYMMIKFSGTQLSSLGHLIPEQEILLSGWSTPLTIFAVIGVINAVNMSDGLDGLAAALISLLLLILIVIEAPSDVLIELTLASLLAFLFWNIRVFRSTARVFMGDAGSTMLGLLVAFFLIQSSQRPHEIIHPTMALWLLALPLIDAVSVLLIRPLRGNSPFSADQIHYHHLIQKRGFSVNATLLIVLLVQLCFVLFAFLLESKGVLESTQLGLFLTCFGLYFLYLWSYTGRAKKSVE